MASPGPQQRFPANITRINFPQIGGLVFLRVAQRWDGDVIPVEPRAFVKGLPWADFDLFAVEDGEKDPHGTPADLVPIANPVTDKMLTKYRYWAHYRKVRADHNSTVAGGVLYVVDLANFTEIYNHVVAGRVYILSTRDDALAYFRGPGLVSGQDPDLVGVGLLRNTGEDIIVNPEPDEYFWGGVRTGGWTYHTEPIPAVPIYKRDEAATIIINLAKLYADMPLVSGKKPAQAKFTITMPVRPHFAVGHGAKLSWSISGSAWSPKLAKPVKDFQRRDFPVEDKTTPVRGILGEFTYDYLVPTFPHPQAQVSDTDVGETERKVDATITFGAGAVPPKIELALAPIIGGEG